MKNAYTWSAVQPLELYTDNKNNVNDKDNDLIAKSN